jgi:hypothetical protein
LPTPSIVKDGDGFTTIRILFKQGVEAVNRAIALAPGSLREPSIISFYSLNQCPRLYSIQQRKVSVQNHILIADNYNDICNTGERRLQEGTVH